ncbi:TB2/DP1, HVA22 family [Teladorsagia circumcincta]|uniref:TB2/DP1, HVA22 family n=1 Tax=Teladorsagia circumcincta TaxID=45464 RepID=A0A2G9UDL6_TELCI|nr:TB2/DP1, HVA22 family [Teladorsagia circumcincta]
MGLTSLYLMLGEEAMFVSYMVTFFYPASVSIEAIKAKGSEAVTQLQYWIAFGFFALLDSTSVCLFPAWYFLKEGIVAASRLYQPPKDGRKWKKMRFYWTVTTGYDKV